MNNAPDSSTPTPLATATHVSVVRGSGRERRRWQRIGMVLLIFLSGAACGTAVATLAVKHAIHHAMQNPQSMSAHITARLAGILDLSEAQSTQVREILLRRHDALIEIRREIQPRLEVELSVLEDEIADILNDDQRAKWRAHAASVRAHWLPPIPDDPTKE